MCVRVCVRLVRQSKIQTTPALREPTAPDLHQTTLVSTLNNDKHNCTCPPVLFFFFTVIGGHIQFQPFYDLVPVFFFSPRRRGAAVTPPPCFWSHPCGRETPKRSDYPALFPSMSGAGCRGISHPQTISNKVTQTPGCNNAKMHVSVFSVTLVGRCLFEAGACALTRTRVGMRLAAKVGLTNRGVFPAKQSGHKTQTN